MADIKIWQFGSRWEALQDYAFKPMENVGVPRPRERSARERSSDQCPDLVLVTLIPANLAVAYFLLREVDRPISLQTTVFDPEFFSGLCYVLVGLLYSLYLAIYYRVIWNPYYSLYEESDSDRRYFLLYALFASVFGIATMLTLPLLWPIYVVILFVPLVYKKKRTQRLFCDAVDDYLNQTSITGDVDQFVASAQADMQPLWVRQLVSARALSVSFSTNFIFWGCVLGIFAFGLLGLVWLQPTFAADWRLGTHQLASVAFLTILGVFIFMKTAGGGIQRIKRQIERGEWEGFTLFRKPWA
jgi:hypothetical protein